MPSNLLYMPAFRARQQEMIVLKSFDFGERMFPLVEIVKAKDRSNNTKTTQQIYSELVDTTNAVKIFLDLPTYIRDVSGMQDEVVTFNRTVLSNLENRIGFYNSLSDQNEKLIPVVSTLILKTGELNTITNQVQKLRDKFNSIAIRTFTNTFQLDYSEINQLLTSSDYLIYDIDESVGLTNPIITKHVSYLNQITSPWKVALRSAINTDIQNVRLDHGEIVYQADNSLLTLYKDHLRCNAFGDYVGIKKDDLSAGGSISPGFIFYNPHDNLYYGFKGKAKDLAEFETTIVPAVISASIIPEILADSADFLNDQNEGWATLQKIKNGETGKSQAKFKKISMDHYIHCLKVKIEKGEIN